MSLPREKLGRVGEADVAERGASCRAGTGGREGARNPRGPGGSSRAERGTETGRRNRQENCRRKPRPI